MNNKPSILQIAPTPFFSDRGCHIRIEGIVRCLEELGYDNTVCTYHHGRDVQGINTKRISTIKNYTKTEAGPSKYKLWADWKLLWLAVREYRRIQPVAIHAHLHEGLMIGLFVKLLFFWQRTPLIADMQGSLVGELDTHGAFKKYPFLRGSTKLLERVLMWCANYIVCSSTHSLEKFKREFNISESKISLAQDGANPFTPLNNEQRNALEGELSLPKDKTIVVYSGALLDSKGLNELKHLIKACQSQTQIHFLIIGYPIENLNLFLSENGLAEHCTLAGQVEFERLPGYLNLADIAIDPKLSDAGEGSGKMLNYLACGLPVVAFETQNNQVFLPAKTSLANNQKALQKLLLRYSEDQNLRIETGKKNLTYFSEKYSWSVTQEQLQTVYQKAIIR